MDSAGPPLIYTIGAPLVGGIVGLLLGGYASKKHRTAARIAGAALGAGAGYGVYYAVANNSFAKATYVQPQIMTTATTTTP